MFPVKKERRKNKGEKKKKSSRLTSKNKPDRSLKVSDSTGKKMTAPGCKLRLVSPVSRSDQSTRPLWNES